jgi:hypothetical protein
MNTLSEFKRGDTFRLVCTYKVDGQPAAILGKTIASQIRRSNGTLVANMAVEPDDEEPAVFVLTPDTNTATWPLDVLLCDIEITEEGFIKSSETIKIPVVGDITR